MIPLLRIPRPNASSLVRLASTSQTSADLPAKPRDFGKEQVEKKESDIVAKILPRTRDLFCSGRTEVPTNLGFPNRRGIENFDPDMPWEDWRRLAKNYAVENVKKYIKEPREMSLEKPDMYKFFRGSLNKETVVYYDFKGENPLDVWNTGCDSDWSEGYSKCNLYVSDKHTAIFEGTLDTRVVKFFMWAVDYLIELEEFANGLQDGKTTRAGYCGMKTRDTLAFNRKKFMDLRFYTHLLIKCRGDGRSYKVMLHSPEYADVTWGDSHSYQLHTHGGPYWQYERIPLSRFFHTVAGRIQDRQYSVKKCRVSSLGIVIMDRIDGDFRLEIDFIAVTNDTSHREQFAYETYQHPIYSVTGF